MSEAGLVRPNNEDSFRVDSTYNGELFVVCDGMGGHVGGATASRIGVDSICQYVSEHECVIPQQFLSKALEFANKQIYNESKANPELKGMGTTACVALVRESKVWYAHVGDSRIYYFNAKSQSLYRLTKDHSVVQAMVDQGLITEAEAEHHPEKNKIRKSLGIKADVEPEQCQMPLVPADDDILLICTDGLSGMVPEEEMLEVLSTTSDVNEAGKTLMELAKASGGTDNITFELVKFSETGNREAIFDAKNRGVTNHQVPPKDNPSKRIWPWVAIVVSLFIISLAALTLFTGRNTNSATETVAMDSVENTTVLGSTTEAYKREIPENVKPYSFDTRGAKWEYYKRPGNPEGDLLINLTNGYYWTGNIEYVSENRIYQGGKSGVKRYNAEGKLISEK